MVEKGKGVLMGNLRVAIVFFFKYVWVAGGEGVGGFLHFFVDVVPPIHRFARLERSEDKTAETGSVAAKFELGLTAFPSIFFVQGSPRRGEQRRVTWRICVSTPWQVRCTSRGPSCTTWQSPARAGRPGWGRRVASRSRVAPWRW